MSDALRSYKYSCRKCTIRQRCIDDKSFGPGLKTTIARRFENRTDTFETWDMLQQDCLLIRYERQDAEKRAYSESGLFRRLRQARETAKEAEPVQPPPGPPQAEPELAAPIPRMERRTFEPTPAPQAEPSISVPCGLTVVASQRIIRLPEHGDVVLGRFEHGFSNPPDIDLTFEDGEIPSVSRRHARVLSKGGQHWIEDLGSTNGTYVNGHPVPLGKTVGLAPGDRILVGRCRMAHSPLPDWVLEPDPRMPHSASLFVTHTGQRLELPDKHEIIVGRPDPTLGFAPDVDLSVAGDISMYVSRRHIKLIARSGWHFMEEVGSAMGTRLNGTLIRVGESPVMLHHGDQMWLGGCVLAYEWILQ